MKREFCGMKNKGKFLWFNPLWDRCAFPSLWSVNFPLKICTMLLLHVALSHPLWSDLGFGNSWYLIISSSVLHLCYFQPQKSFIEMCFLSHYSLKMVELLVFLLGHEVGSGSPDPFNGTSIFIAVSIHWDSPTQYSQEAWKALLVLFIFVELEWK